MKKISFFSVLLFVAGLFLAGGALTSCGSDDNKNNPEGGGSGGGSDSGGGSGSGGGSPTSLVGNVWYNVDEDASYIGIEAYQFNADGSGRGAEMSRNSTDNYRQTRGESWRISYTLSGDILTITELIEGENDVNTYRVAFNADGTMTWTRVKDGNVGKSYVYRLLPPSPDPQVALEGVLNELVENRRN